MYFKNMLALNFAVKVLFTSSSHSTLCQYFSDLRLNSYYLMDYAYLRRGFIGIYPDYLFTRYRILKYP